MMMQPPINPNNNQIQESVAQYINEQNNKREPINLYKLILFLTGHFKDAVTTILLDSQFPVDPLDFRKSARLNYDVLVIITPKSLVTFPYIVYVPRGADFKAEKLKQLASMNMSNLAERELGGPRRNTREVVIQGEVMNLVLQQHGGRQKRQSINAEFMAGHMYDNSNRRYEVQDEFIDDPDDVTFNDNDSPPPPPQPNGNINNTNNNIQYGAQPDQKVDGVVPKNTRGVGRPRKNNSSSVTQQQQPPYQ